MADVQLVGLKWCRSQLQLSTKMLAYWQNRLRCSSCSLSFVASGICSVIMASTLCGQELLC